MACMARDWNSRFQRTLNLAMQARNSDPEAARAQPCSKFTAGLSSRSNTPKFSNWLTNTGYPQDTSEVAPYENPYAVEVQSFDFE